MNDEDAESRQIWVEGFVVRDPPPRPSNFRSQRSLEDDLIQDGIGGISGVDDPGYHPLFAGDGGNAGWNF